MPLADALIGELESRRSGDENRIAALDRLERLYGFDPKSFEARLAALSLSPESAATIRGEIAERMHRRQPTLYPYELLAHLLKHRFLDAVINFNFDELLDQSLSDELGDSEFRSIVTERDCAHLQLDATAGDYLPLHIKMHGTASEPETLRFTQEAYYWTPKKIVTTVEALLDTQHCVIVNIGYQMANFDFQYLLRKPHRLSLFHIDPFQLTEKAHSKIRDYRAQQRPGGDADGAFTVTNCAPSKEVAESPRRNAFLDSAFDGLVSALKSEANRSPSGDTVPRAHWRSTERHRAVAQLLRDCDLDNDRHYVEYLRRRTIIEIAFAATKARGVVSIEPLIADRPGRCYEAYRRAAAHADSKPEPWAALCRAGGLARDDDFPSDTYFPIRDVMTQGHDPKAADDPLEVHRLQLIDPKRMARHVLSHLDPVEWAEGSLPGALARWSSDTRQFHRALVDLVGGTEVELHATDDRICSRVFERPRVLVTLTGLRGWTHRLLTRHNYTELLISAESGAWLADYLNLIPESVRIRLIAAVAPSATQFDDLETLVNPAPRDFGKDVKPDHSITRVMLPWWRHNRHMTILRNGDEPVAALHFARRLRTSSITPVFLDDAADARAVERSFELLWGEAVDYTSRVVQLRDGEERRADDRRQRDVAVNPDRRGAPERRRSDAGARRVRNVDRRGVPNPLQDIVVALGNKVPDRG